MKTLLLLAAVLDDWYQANECRQDADALWRIVRRWHPEGENEAIDIYIYIYIYGRDPRFVGRVRRNIGAGGTI
jgi:hypothetical protein